jgi:hypothetical protein
MMRRGGVAAHSKPCGDQGHSKSGSWPPKLPLAIVARCRYRATTATNSFSTESDTDVA